MSLIVTDGTEQLEAGLQIVADLAHRGQIPTSVAVVRCTPHGDDILVVEMVFISLVHQLVCAGNQREVVDVTELVRHAIAEEPS